MRSLTDIFAAKVKEALGDRSPYWLAKASGVSDSTLSRIFAGKMSPTLEKVEEIAKALEVPPSSLLGGEETGIPADILSMLAGHDTVVYDAIRGILKPLQTSKKKPQAKKKT